MKEYTWYPDIKSYVKDNNVVVIPIAKTGTNSTREFLGQHLLEDPHFTMTRLIQEVGRPTLKNLVTFAIVRNPYDRAVSWWASMNSQKVTMGGTAVEHFDRWIGTVYCGKRYDYRFLLPQVQWLTDGGDRPWTEGGPADGEILTNFIIRFENIAEEWGEHFDGDLPHNNKSKRSRDYRKFYTEFSKKMVYDLWRPDFERFGYEF